ncbi:MAG: phosphatidylglycerophosphatase A [Acidobacteriota bacterium]
MTKKERAAGPKWALGAASLLGLGFSPIMPGTMGALAGFFLYLPAFFLDGKSFVFLAAAETALAWIIAAFAIPPVLKANKVLDPSYIIIDEVAGMTLALIFTPPEFVRLLLAFVFFRLLDILKPFPINKLEHLPGWWGVMADDALAGLLAGLLAWAVVILV